VAVQATHIETSSSTSCRKMTEAVLHVTHEPLVHCPFTPSRVMCQEPTGGDGRDIQPA